MKKFIALVSFFVAFIALLILNPIVIISAGERGIVMKWGAVQDKVLSEGIHWIAPIANDVEKLDVKTQKEEVEVTAASKDLQTVNSTIALNYHLDVDRVNQLWQKIGKDYKSRIIDPAVQEAMKAASAKFTADELITKREQVKQEAKQTLKERLSLEYIIVDELSIVNFEFSAEFNKSIEQKVKAEQDALTAKNKLEQIKYEAEQKIATAEAEAKSIRLQSDAANNEKYVALKALEVQLEMAKRWDGKLPVNVYGSAPIPFLNINK